MIFLGNGNGTFQIPFSYLGESSFSADVELADLNLDGFLDLVTAGADLSHGYATVRLGNGNGSFRAATSYLTQETSSSALALADVNGDGLIDLLAVGTNGANSQATVRLGAGNGSFDSPTSFAPNGPGSCSAIQLGDVNGDGVLDLVSAGYDGWTNTGFAAAQIQTTMAGTTPLLPFSLRTKADALQALPFVKQSLARVSAQRGVIGALQSRLSSAVATLQTARENYNSARSLITDVDVALESAELVRNKILQNAASSILSQANQEPALALVLLWG